MFSVSCAATRWGFLFQAPRCHRWRSTTHPKMPDPLHSEIQDFRFQFWTLPVNCHSQVSLKGAKKKLAREAVTPKAPRAQTVNQHTLEHQGEFLAIKNAENPQPRRRRWEVNRAPYKVRRDRHSIEQTGFKNWNSTFFAYMFTTSSGSGRGRQISKKKLSFLSKE